MDTSAVSTLARFHQPVILPGPLPTPQGSIGHLIRKLTPFVSKSPGTPLPLEALLPELAEEGIKTRFLSMFEYGFVTLKDYPHGSFYLRTKFFDDVKTPHPPFLTIKFNAQGALEEIKFILDSATSVFLLGMFPSIGLFKDLLDILNNPYLTKARRIHLTKQLDTACQEQAAFEKEAYLIAPRTTHTRQFAQFPSPNLVAPVYVGGYGFAGGKGHHRYLATWGLGSCFALVLFDKKRRLGALAHFYCNSLVTESVKTILIKMKATDLTARIIGGNKNTNPKMLWQLYRALPKGTPIVEEDILGDEDKTRSLLFDTATNEVFDIAGLYYSPEYEPNPTEKDYIRKRIRRLFREAFDGQRRMLIQDTSQESYSMART